ncbi:MAG: murein biosynthesis integral membrane protein MurJ [Anaerolineae bacterium]|nr:MAG: integral membrane protein MviN [Chloroflexi bacterium OLB13]MBW7878314.1 murein biosynthesis integral membrane protein MurJ [Anaerolineae bacterium]MEB2365165.1 murein biosynthesis integral membrane protein MurJ [Chloroflexota bacterium]
MTQPETRDQQTRRIARSTAVVMVSFAVAKAISLLQTVVIANAFGLGSEWDAYVAANRIPELIFTLISGGALATAFLPVFSGMLAEGKRDDAWRTASHVINFVFSVTLAVSAIVFVFAPQLVASVVAPGFDAETQAQTVALMRLLLVSTLIFSVSGIVMGILQSHNHFLLPALAPIMFDVGILFGVIVLLGPFGVNGIAMGAVLGAAMHLVTQVPGLIHFKARWSPGLGLRDPQLWRIIRLMIPRIGGLGVFSLNFLVMNNIASRLGTGSVAALDWGWRLMQIPQTLIGTAMGVVVFPTLAAFSELGDVDGKRSAMSGAVRFILIGTIPASVALVVSGQPLISLLERGAFDASASALVYSTLVCFSLGLIVHSVLEVVARSFYADKDTFTPFVAALAGAAINLVGSFAFSGVLTVDPAAGSDRGFVGGLALANSLGVMAEVAILIFILRRRWAGIEGDTLTRTLIHVTAASLVMGAAVFAFNTAWGAFGLPGGLLWTIIQVAANAVIGITVFVGMAIVLRIRELRVLMDVVLRRREAAAEALTP